MQKYILYVPIIAFVVVLTTVYISILLPQNKIQVPFAGLIVGLIGFIGLGIVLGRMSTLIIEVDNIQKKQDIGVE